MILKVIFQMRVDEFLYIQKTGNLYNTTCKIYLIIKSSGIFSPKETLPLLGPQTLSNLT